MKMEAKEVIVIDKAIYENLRAMKGKTLTGGDVRKNLLEEIRQVKENFKNELNEKALTTLNKEWPEEACKVGKIIRNTTIGIGANSAFFLSKQGRKNQALLNIVRRNLPLIAELTNEGVVTDGFQQLEKAVRANKGVLNCSCCFLAEGEDIKTIMENLARIKGVLEESWEEMFGSQIKQNKDLDIAAATGVDIKLIRKLVEIVFAETELNNVNILLSPNSNVAKQGTSSPNNGPFSGLITVKSNGISYADMTKAVKEAIEPDQLKEMGLEVKNIKKGKNNDVVIITKNREGGDALKKEILK